MTDETIRELRREHEACVVRAAELSDVAIHLRSERIAIRNQMEEIVDAIYDRECMADMLRIEYTRRAGSIKSVLNIYDKHSQA